MQDDDSTAEGPCPWRQDLDPLLRPQVLEKIARTLAQVYHGQLDSTADLNGVAARFENKVFQEANSKGDYLRRVSYKLSTLELQKQKLLQRAASIHHHQVQMGSHMRPVNAIHAINGGNSSTQVPSISTHGRQSSQLQSLPTTSLVSGLVPNQNVACPSAQNITSTLSKNI
ncbi:hypothetical protein PVAP13_7NG022200 [Panicum virgatum]|uniref:Mediator complex subunit 15 KIX domain-containing protein n=1 Tax=Panicum virgatum TaxID=38727 RepID=A0A8T0PR34_PANVG|nr:hypothetical protein PVAP13_7NG022200 [Panicum virgatum]